MQTRSVAQRHRCSPLGNSTKSLQVQAQSHQATCFEYLQQLRHGFLHSEDVKQILDAAGIPRVSEIIVSSKDEALNKSAEIGFPMVMKVVGPVHKTDVGGVVLNVSTLAGVKHHFKKLIKK